MDYEDCGCAECNIKMFRPKPLSDKLKVLLASPRVEGLWDTLLEDKLLTIEKYRRLYDEVQHS